MVAQALSEFMMKAREIGIIEVQEDSNGGSTIYHLQFANDNLLFCEVSKEELFGVKTVLRCFKLATRMRVN